MKIISDARKIIFRPASNAPVVAFPEGATINNYGAGNEAPSIVVRNATEANPSWQGVSYDTGCVIVNGVPEDVANEALNIYETGDKTIDALNAVIEYLLREGYGDQYTTPINFVEANLSPAGRMLDDYTGIVKRDNRDLIDVWQSGGAYHVLTDGDRVIESDILVRDYRMPNGSTIDLDAVPENMG